VEVHLQLVEWEGSQVFLAVIFDITERKQAQRELERKAAITRLMESLARASNEATTPEDALKACLAQICDYGGWTLGRVGTFASGQRLGAPQSSVWHSPQAERFAGFVEISNRYAYTGRLSGQFVSEALRKRRAVWVSDLSTTPGFGRLAEAVKSGIRAGFVFPVVVGDEPLAFLEFFADEVRTPDEPFLEAINSISAQLARIIERRRALDEMRANEQKLEGILGSLHEVVWSMDARSGRVLYLNTAAKRAAGAGNRASTCARRDACQRAEAGGDPRLTARGCVVHGCAQRAGPLPQHGGETPHAAPGRRLSREQAYLAQNGPSR